MDYEIDIEEHDVLDNPAIKKIFPDISVIKKEITQYFEEEPTLKEEPEIAGETQPQKLSKADIQDASKNKITSEKSHIHTTFENEKTQPLQTNIIILGSKPKPVTQDTNKKLILCTKLVTHNDTRNVVSKITHEDKVKIKHMQLILQDIKSYLNQNGRYCKLCCRLFLSKNALNVHKNKVHHNKICKNKPNNITNKIKTIETQNKCTICGSCFSNNGNLFRHYRTIHQKIIKFERQGLHKVYTRANPQNKCSICGFCFSNKGNLFRHYRTVHQKKIKLKGQDLKTRAKQQRNNSTVFKNKINQMKTTSRKNQITSKKNVQTCNKCNICNIKFSTYGSLKRHNGKKHPTNLDLDAIESDLVTEDIPSISRGKEKRRVILATEHFRNISARAKRKDISIKENSVPIDKFAHKNNENKLKTHNVATDKQRLQVLSADKSREVAFVKEDSKPKYDTRAKNNTTKDSNLCLHCKKDFPDQKSLIEHMYEILEPKINSSGLTKTVSVTTNKVDDKILFKCRQCSYYLPSIKSYFTHMTRNHKTESFLEVKKEEFDAQCKYCPYMSSSVATYNKHINSYHIDLMFLRIENEIENDKNKQKINNEKFNLNAMTEFSSFALESVLFECNKCNVCFLSSNIARDHNQHNMEMLNNWKCSVCHHILKEQDKEKHLIQHSFSQPIKVYTVNETAISNVLYNCTKCAIHFIEKRYQEHYANCGSGTTDSYYCSVCDILVDKMEMINHKTQHEHLRDMSDFIIVDSNIIVDIASSLKRKATNIESEVRPRKRLYEQHNCLTYCYTCKSFLSDSGLKNKSHIQRTCSHLPTYACTVCGLVFTSSTLKIHKERHEKEKNFRLQDYKFFNLQGIQIIPPIPKYPHCKICKIHFLGKNAVFRHICDETDFLTCDICNIKLSEKTYKLHMSFHFYVLRKTSPLKGNSSAQQTHEILKDPTKRKASELSTEYELKKPEELNHKLETESSEAKLTEIPDVSDNDKNNEMVDQEENSIDLVEEHNAEQVPNEDSLVVLYTCKTCGVTVESYDEVIKHCQAHYSTKENQVTSMKKCKLCSLKFDSRSYLNHESKVHSSISKIQVLKFDPSYFTSKNMVWVKHIFQTLPEEIGKELLKNSIYQHEHRIQLECIQKGSSPIYVYKCDSCGNFIDPGCVYKHAENPCNKVRKHPCSLCGLPYISIVSRNSHEKLHKQIKGLTKKALNIILFNQTKDKTFNDRIYRTVNEYLFYQCRNCDRVVEKLMIKDHVCDNVLVKCVTCGLLLSKEDFQAHLNKHNDLENFCSDNFKVVLFGNKNTKSKDASKKLTSCFSGTVYDYTLYKCQICEMCLKNNENSDKHTCIPNFDLDRSMCSECDLYFPSGNLKHHMKQHRIDPDFVKENINVITFNDDFSNTNKSFSSHKTKNNKITQIKGNLIVDDDNGKSVNNEIEQNIDNDTKIDESKNGNDILSIEMATKTNVDDYKEKCYENVDNDRVKNIDDYNELGVYCGKILDDDKIKSNDNDNDGNDKSINVMDDNANEEFETLYKCKCGLHFLNKQKVTEHVNKCQPKAKQYKQNCSKCHLLFNPSELFSHLVIHHGDKTQVHNYKVIEISIDGQEVILSTFETTQSLNASKQ